VKYLHSPFLFENLEQNRCGVIAKIDLATNVDCQALGRLKVRRSLWQIGNRTSRVVLTPHLKVAIPAAPLEEPACVLVCALESQRLVIGSSESAQLIQAGCAFAVLEI
jgi:hypothetical protein